MIKTGLVSITFRSLSPREIVKLVKQAGLTGIEWGGDVHVPHGSLNTAREVLDLTQEAGLEVAAYGSYYSVGENNEVGFSQVLETAKTLNAPVVRVWAGKRGSAEADKRYWNKLIEEAREISELALKESIKVAFEFHGNTLTDTARSAEQLLTDINHTNIRSYWQPPIGIEKDVCLKGLELVLPWLENLHVFYWVNGQRLPLKYGAGELGIYIEAASKAKGDRYAMIEFVKDDEAEQFLEDAYILKKIVMDK